VTHRFHPEFDESVEKKEAVRESQNTRSVHQKEVFPTNFNFFSCLFMCPVVAFVSSSSSSSFVSWGKVCAKAWWFVEIPLLEELLFVCVTEVQSQKGWL
jgi:hypothetical protein